MIVGPFKVMPSGDMFVLFNSRNGHIASYPTTKAKAQAEARFMNRKYREAVAEAEGEKPCKA